MTWRHADLDAIERSLGLEPIADLCHLCEANPLPASRVICDRCLSTPEADTTPRSHR